MWIAPNCIRQEGSTLIFAQPIALEGRMVEKKLLSDIAVPCRTVSPSLADAVGDFHGKGPIYRKIEVGLLFG